MVAAGVVVVIVGVLSVFFGRSFRDFLSCVAHTKVEKVRVQHFFFPGVPLVRSCTLLVSH